MPQTLHTSKKLAGRPATLDVYLILVTTVHLPAKKVSGVIMFICWIEVLYCVALHKKDSPKLGTMWYVNWNIHAEGTI